MSKINKKLIKNSLKTLTILAFALLVIPATAKATSYGTNTLYSTGGYSGSYGYQSNNPVPSVDSVSPSYANVGSGAKTITIFGNGFVPGSIARVNGADRYTTFIDSSHLFIQLTSNDMFLGNGFYITVWNGAPGGGFSNSSFFTLNKAVAYNAPAPVTYNPYNNNQAAVYNYGYDYNAPAPSAYTYGPNGYANPNQPVPDSTSALASNALYGSNTFLPSGIIQWILFAIFVLLIVILVRRIFGARENYQATPLKHD
jgi:hypothetical protein